MLVSSAIAFSLWRFNAAFRQRLSVLTLVHFAKSFMIQPSAARANPHCSAVIM
jgi:hypothetical protein